MRSCAGHPPLVTYDPVLRGRLVAPDGEELYLRRVLDGLDPALRVQEIACQVQELLLALN